MSFALLPHDLFSLRTVKCSEMQKEKTQNNQVFFNKQLMAKWRVETAAVAITDEHSFSVCLHVALWGLSREWCIGLLLSSRDASPAWVSVESAKSDNFEENYTGQEAPGSSWKTY